MSNALARRYFNAIRDAWAPFADDYLIIPFCTPVMARPTAIIVGTNHSEFVDGGGERSKLIAEGLASGIPDESTFLVHSHKFARGMHEVCHRAGIRIDETWVGTNRCGVQTGPNGLAGIETDPAFSACQEAMDRILRELLSEIAPRNIILVGKYAAGLFYRNSMQATFTTLQPKDMRCPGADYETKILPIQHPSRATFWQPAAERLRQHFTR